MNNSEIISNAFSRKLHFIEGKGGVGKSSFSKGLALSFSKAGKKTLWVTFEQKGSDELKEVALGTNLTHIDIQAKDAFQEYIYRKFKFGKLAKPFIQNPLIQYLVEVAPGFPELLKLGKVWDETRNFEKIVVDMPSTGYALSMFQATFSFAELFKGGRVHEHAEEMIKTFRDPEQTSHMIVSIPEETPLRESLELSEKLLGYFPNNPSFFVLNKKFPTGDHPSQPHSGWLPNTLKEYVDNRRVLEIENLKLWDSLFYLELPYFNPGISSSKTDPKVIQEVSKHIQEKGWIA